MYITKRGINHILQGLSYYQWLLLSGIVAINYKDETMTNNVAQRDCSLIMLGQFHTTECRIVAIYFKTIALIMNVTQWDCIHKLRTQTVINQYYSA